MRIKRRLLYIFFYLILFCLPIFSVNATESIKILLVPGHDNAVWGAQYGNMKEAEMTLALATRIYNLLKKDKRFELYITRDGGDSFGYTQKFGDYFTKNKDEILAFKKNAKDKMQTNIADGSFIQKQNVPHHTVSPDVALRLYGFNKWANENKIDAVVHIHFNDYPRAKKWTIGKYTGLTVYFPDGQLANFKESANLAADIFTQLHKKYATSTYPPELGGLISDQKLIALGSNGTLDASVRSVLIEYGYIYQKKFRKSSTRVQAYENMASLTATGIKNYFFTPLRPSS